MKQEAINPDTATEAQLSEWLRWDASDATILYWADRWLLSQGTDTLREMVRDALEEPHR